MRKEEWNRSYTVRDVDLAYAKQLMRQNAGLPCEYCNASWGHRGICDLVNSKRKSPVPITVTTSSVFSESDVAWLKEFHVSV